MVFVTLRCDAFAEADPVKEAPNPSSQRRCRDEERESVDDSNPEDRFVRRRERARIQGSQEHFRKGNLVFGLIQPSVQGRRVLRKTLLERWFEPAEFIAEPEELFVNALHRIFVQQSHHEEVVDIGDRLVKRLER